ncbi:hypothetical protein EV368DRAFT_89306 [Lentinula lateritia]|nr:hypothetical protein EV368DRAFT_89306 [Lentinula lateritia]
MSLPNFVLPSETVTSLISVLQQLTHTIAQQTQASHNIGCQRAQYHLQSSAHPLKDAVVVPAKTVTIASAAAATAAHSSARSAQVEVSEGEPVEKPDTVYHHRVGKKWYSVTAGLAVGIFPSTSFAQPLVLGVSRGLMCGFPTREEAQADFDLAQKNGLLRIIQ